MKISVFRTFALAAMALLLVVTACDTAETSTDETVVLSDPANPTEETFSFAFAFEDYNQSTGTVTVSASAIDQSPSRPDLDAILREGYLYDGGRSVIVSATVTSVQVDDVSSASSAAQATPEAKLFPPYLSRAEIYLDGSSGPLVAEGAIPSDGPAPLPVPNDGVTVTSTLKGMTPTRATLVLEVSDPSAIPTQAEGGDKIDATLTYEIRAPQQ